MKRVLVIGSGGAGKSTVAQEIGGRLDIPVIHLDSHYWKPGWVESPSAEWSLVVQELVGRESWIMDGNYGGTLDLRIDSADTIVFLDIHRLVCLWRVARRRFRYHGRSRPDMSPGCPERVDAEFIHWIWTYRRRRRPHLLCKLDAFRNTKQIFVLRSRGDVRSFLNALPTNAVQASI